MVIFVVNIHETQLKMVWNPDDYYDKKFWLNLKNSFDFINLCNAGRRPIERFCTGPGPLEWFSMQSVVWDTSWMELVKDTQIISTVRYSTTVLHLSIDCLF